MKIIKIQENVFKTDVLIIANCTLRECDTYLKSIKNKYLAYDPNYTNVLGRMIRTNNDVYRIIWIGKLDKKNITTLVHELFHLVIRICEDKGVPIIPNVQNGMCGDETAAYLYEFYFREIYKKIK